ncbi:hypothetical protein QEG98_00710 [Myxococcus sp. MxC21-1]|uniref:hypothetical protein n=1 Tax=Myxococcus sp. MxC21-1 TaxID=3041439 RepID=UPI00292FEF58|nr:hypothetical protein [Myxococcus sp. MxC21-1]WNZ62413.1 hypothetical protein QEG98_00710 [Myxococcus sp. MxC21-1]
MVRTFGRQRLAALARLLPHAKSVRVQLMGPGLPVFWVIDMGAATLTLGLTGWTESGWSSAAAFDVLMPRAVPDGLAEQLRNRLRTEGPCPSTRSPPMPARPRSPCARRSSWSACADESSSTWRAASTVRAS